MERVVIVVSLICEHEHRFEGWFASEHSFTAQQEIGQLSCPVCGAQRVVRAEDMSVLEANRPAQSSVTPIIDNTEAETLLHMLVQKLQDEAMKENQDGIFTFIPFAVDEIRFTDANEHAVRSVAALLDLDSVGEEVSAVPDKSGLH